MSAFTQIHNHGVYSGRLMKVIVVLKCVIMTVIDVRGGFKITG